MSKKAGNGVAKVQERVQEFVKEGFQTAVETINKVEEEGKKIANRLVEQVESKIPAPQKEKLENVISIAKQTRKDIEKRVEEGLGKTLGVLNIPSRSDIEKLDKKVEELSRKVSALSRSKKGTAKMKSAAA